MIQLVQPNLDTIGNIGYCLAMAENVFGTPHLYATATDGWNATQFKHTDALPDVIVPVWFSYFESGINYGHVAAWVPGRGVLSSPYKANNTQQWFSSVDECASVLRCTYLGWSEDIATVRIVQEGAMSSQDLVDETTVRLVFDLGLNRDASADDISGRVGNQTVEQLLRDIWNSAEHAALLAKPDPVIVHDPAPPEIPVPQPPTDPGSVVITKDSLWAKFIKWFLS